MISILRHILFISIFLLYSFSSVNFNHISSLKIQGDFMDVDHLDNIYLVQNDQLLKYDDKGNLVKTFSNKTLGRITSIDVSNPLKILVFYKNFNRLIFLDNTLSIKGDIVQLTSLEMDQTTLGCSSFNNGFWLYESQIQQLIRFDEGLTQSQKSGNIFQLTDKEIYPDFLIEENNLLFLKDSKTGIFIFDRYGGYLRMIPVKIFENIQVIKNKIYYLSDKSTLTNYDLLTLQESSIKLPIENIKSFKICNNKIYLLTTEGIEVYALTIQ